jgi:hypothetical protein
MSLTNIEKEVNIILHTNIYGELKKYKKSGGNYKKICENPDCISRAKSKEDYCKNFLHHGFCKKNSFEIKLTNDEINAGIILGHDKKGNTRKYIIKNNIWTPICTKQNCLSAAKNGIFCKRFTNTNSCKETKIISELTLTEKEKEAGIILKKNDKGHILKRLKINDRLRIICSEQDCINQTEHISYKCQEHGGYDICDDILDTGEKC